MQTKRKPVSPTSSSWFAFLGFIVTLMIRFLLPAMAVLKWRETRRFVINLRVEICSCRSRFDSSPPNGYKSHWFNVINQNLTLHGQYNQDFAFKDSYLASRRWLSPIKMYGLASSLSIILTDPKIERNIIFCIMATSSVLLSDLEAGSCSS